MRTAQEDAELTRDIAETAAGLVQDGRRTLGGHMLHGREVTRTVMGRPIDGVGRPEGIMGTCYIDDSGLLKES